MTRAVNESSLLEANEPGAEHGSPHPLAWRGLVEGFYGAPWSHDDRVRWFEFASGSGLDRYLYAPKDDPWHRELWREPYPADRLAALGDLCSEAERRGVRFVYTIAPGLSMRYDEDAEHEALAAKCAQLFGAGIRSFALLFDDVPMDEPEAFGRAHGETAARLEADFLGPAGIDEPLLVCPTDYAGLGRTPYRSGLDATLPQDALVLWTGADIVVGAVTADDILRARESYGRDLVLWDNFPVNDFDRSRVFLGPLTGRATAPGLVGIAANPMVEAAPSRFALSTVAEWAADPDGYDPQDASARAYERVTGGAPGLHTLVEACSSWPPSAPRWPALSDAVAEGRYHDAEALLARLTQTSSDGVDEDLAAQLEPWVDAAQASGSAGAMACRVLAFDGDPTEFASLDELLKARRTMEGEFADVVRDDVLGLLDDAIVLLGGEPSHPHTPHGAAVSIYSGPNPAPGDRELAEFLRGSGMHVHFGHDEAADLVIVTRSASEDLIVEASRLSIPVLAWGHLVPLGLASASLVPLSVDRIEIVDPRHAAASAMAGEVVVYRGRSKLTVCVPGEGAHVVAREPQSGDAAITITPRGAALANGKPAPAARGTFYLAADGFAPWLVTESTRALLYATIGALLDAEDA